MLNPVEFCNGVPGAVGGEVGAGGAVVATAHAHAAPAPGGFFANLFATDFVPRAACVGERAEIVWLHVLSDGLIALSYFSIPVALFYFARRRADLSYRWMFLLFAAFILACGATHLMGVLAFWHPMYRLDGVIKALTGGVSAATAFLLWPLIPKALALPSPADLRRANEALAREVREKDEARARAAALAETLEARVVERTAELERVNAELRSSRETLALAMRAGRMGAWSRDVRTDEVWWSRELEEIFGLPPSGFGGDLASFENLVHPDDLPALRAAVERAVAERADYSVEFRYRHATGEWRWMDGRGRAEYDAQGRPTVLHGLGIDITQRVRDGAALAESERRHRFILESIPQIVFTTRPDGVTNYHNRRLDELTGASRADLARLGWTHFRHPDDRARASEAWARSVREASPYECEYRMRDAAGEYRWHLARATPMKDDAGRVVMWCGTVTDVHEDRAQREALEESGARLRLALEAAGLGVWGVDPGTGAFWCDERAAAMHGWKEDERPTLERAMERLHPEDRGAAAAAFERTLREGEPYRSETRVLCPSGEVRWVAVRARRHEGTGRVYGVAQDVTERRRAEEALRESDRFKKLLLSNSLVGLYVFDLATLRHTYVNPEYTRLTGYTMDDLSALTAEEVMELFHPDDRDAVRAHMDSARAGGPGDELTLEYRFRAKDGRWLTCLSREALIPGAGDGAGRLVGTFIDVTALRESERQLRESEGRFRSMADGAPVMIWVTEADGSCTFLNERWREFTGQTEQEGLGLGWLDAVHPDDRPATERLFLDASARSEPFRVEYRLRRADGVYRWAIDAARPRRAADGSFMGYIGSVIDITERREIEERLRESEERLRESEERFRVMADGLPHIVWVHGPEGELQTVNRTYRETFGVPEGWPESEASWRILVHPEDEPAYVAAFLGAVRERGVFHAEVRAKDALGRWRWLESWGRPRFSASGEYLGHVGASVDVTERKEAEGALAASRAERDLLAGIIEASDQPLATAYKDGRMGIANAAYARLTGYSRDELAAVDWARVLTPPEWEEAEARALEELHRTRRPVRYEKEYVRKDGTRVPVELLAHLGESPALGGDFYYGFITDLTERKRAERALRDSEERFRTFMDNSPAAAWIVDGEGVFRYASATYYRMFGVGEAPLEGRSYHDFYPPEIAGEYAANDRRVLESGLPVESIEGGLRPDGSRGAFLVCKFPLQDAGGERLVGGVAIDVSERRRAEEALRESEERFRTAAAAVSDIVWTNDSSGRMTGPQPGWERFTGQTTGEVQGYGWTSAVHPEDAGPTVAAWERAVEERRVFVFEHRVRRHDGAWRTCALRAVPLLEPDGSVREWVGVHTDVTDQRAAEEALRRDRDKLESLVAERTAELVRSQEALRLSERMASMGTLAAGLGHDIGNILMPVREWLDELEGAELTGAARGAVASIRRSAQHLQALSAGLRALALDPDDRGSAYTDLGEWWRGAAPLLRAVMPKGVTLEGPEVPAGAAAQVPPHALSQAVFNLVQNAGDVLAARGGGTVRVGVRADGPTVEVSVSDDGPGMSAEVASRCFEPFFTTKPRGRGTGLGLSLVHSIVERHGGTIRLRTAPGEGAEFTLALPGAPEGAAPPGASMAVRVGDAHLAAVVRAIGDTLGLRPGEAGAAEVWVVDASATEDELRDFLARGGSVVALRAPGTAHPRVHVVEDKRPSALRDALRAAIGGGPAPGGAA